MSTVRLAGIVIAGGLLLWSAAAAARSGIRVGLGPDFGAPFGAGAEVTTGLGVSVQGGYCLEIAGLEVVPEASLRFIEFASDTPGEGEADRNTLQVMGGGRVGLGTHVIPQVFFHVGYGLVTGEGAGYSLTQEGVTLEAGLGVDLALLSWVRVGVSASYSAVWPGGGIGPYQWLGLGARAAAIF
jgi:hypothetical protein